MPRLFGKVGASLDKSDKWCALESDGHRLAYTWLHWCRYGNPLGLYHLPPIMMADGLGWTLDACHAALQDLERVGLIQTAPGHVIRVTNWFTQHNAPRNPSAAIGLFRAMSQKVMIGDCLPRSCAFLELLHVTCGLLKSGNWDGTSKTYQQLTETVEAQALAEWRATPLLVQEAMATLGLEPGGMVWGNVWDMVSTKSGQRVGTVRTRERE